jgi:hypothetical protein
MLAQEGLGLILRISVNRPGIVLASTTTNS